MSDKSLNIPLLNELDFLSLSSNKRLIDNITGSHLNADKLELNPYQVVWLSIAE